MVVVLPLPLNSTGGTPLTLTALKEKKRNVPCERSMHIREGVQKVRRTVCRHCAPSEKKKKICTCAVLQGSEEDKPVCFKQGYAAIDQHKTMANNYPLVRVARILIYMSHCCRCADHAS